MRILAAAAAVLALGACDEAAQQDQPPPSPKFTIEIGKGALLYGLLPSYPIVVTNHTSSNAHIVIVDCAVRDAAGELLMSAPATLLDIPAGGSRSENVILPRGTKPASLECNASS